MLYLDLNVNGVQLYTGQACFGQVVVQNTPYLQFSGALMFIDNLGMTDPEWEGLGSRYSLIYFSSAPVLEIPLQATPVQNLSVILDGQNCVMGLYEQTIDTNCSCLVPVGADAAYTRQSFIAPTLQITAPASVAENAGPFTATIPPLTEGTTIVWSVSSGAIVSGQGTTTLQFNSGATDPLFITAKLSCLDGCLMSVTQEVTVNTGVMRVAFLAGSFLDGTPGGDGTGAGATFAALVSGDSDLSGNLYWIESNGPLIRKITSGGVATTFAGTAGSPQGGPAMEGGVGVGAFQVPVDAKLGPDGSLYVLDQFACRIFKVDAGGNMTFWVGDGTDAIADGTGTGAQVSSGMKNCAFDSSGNLWFIDGATIRKATPAGVVTTEVAPSPAPWSTLSTGLAIDASDNLYFGGEDYNVYKVTPGLVVSYLCGTSAAGDVDGTPGVGSFSGGLWLSYSTTDSLIYFCSYFGPVGVEGRIGTIDPATGDIATLVHDAADQPPLDGPIGTATTHFPLGIVAARGQSGAYFASGPDPGLDVGTIIRTYILG